MCQQQITIGACGHQISSFVARSCLQKLHSHSTGRSLFSGPHMMTTNVIHSQRKCSSCSARSAKYLQR
jgi:hypothetical protein